MAYLTLSRSSSILKNQTKVQVIMPDQLVNNCKLPVLWLLHGLGDDGSCWQRKTNLEQLASKYQLCIIMPDCERSFYTNMIYGGHYWDYLTQELIPEMRLYLPISSEVADNYVAGNSMGGYGALKLGFMYPEWFSAIAAISPVVDLSVVPEIMPDYQAVFGKNGINEQKYRLKNMVQESNLTALHKIRWYHSIGNLDFMKQANDSFDSYLVQQLELTVTYKTGPGNHDWDYWNEQIGMVLNWLMTSENEVVK